MNQVPTPSFPSGLAGSQRRAIRFIVSPDEGQSFNEAEFVGLDRARLHAWDLALQGNTTHISKKIYDTIPSPAVPLGSAVIETWDERSAFLVLNGEFRKR